MQASLLLEDGTYFCTQSIGANAESVGELVFNTAMTGYEEVISDPSYLGQMVLFTTSYIGNTGITVHDLESPKMYAEAILCKNICLAPDNFRSQKSLEEFLQEQNKMALTNLDTRFLTQKIRDHGSLMAICSTKDHDKQSLMNKLKNASTIKTENQSARYVFSSTRVNSSQMNKKYKIAVIDFGIKQGIINCLQNVGCEVVLFPYTVSVEDIEAIQPDGLFFSNGPGDPKVLSAQCNILNVIYTLSQKYPTFGICLGHQLIALAYGENTIKLSYGHHAVNHPVKNLFTKNNESHIYITSQNHNYVVELNSETNKNCFEITHRHLNDNTIAGLKHKTLPIFSVQFHPESNPGPRDAEKLFENFVSLIEGKKD